MIRRTVTLIAAALSSTLLLVTEVYAETPLNRAVLEALRNNVQLLPENQSPRSARVSDVVAPGDGVSTATGAFAELRFNDGSLGRLGEQVVFWFASGTRDFRLSNGTVLMLIPPGQGRTHIRTPNAAAGIQGSALFVRYIAETDTTIVGALTDSGIEVFNQDGSQRQQLRGGQMAIAVGDQIERIYDFDLKTFYETSELVQGLSPLDAVPTSPAADPAVRQVQAEMQSAIEQQPSFPTADVIEAPTFIEMPEGSPGEFPTLPAAIPPEAFPTPNGLDTVPPVSDGASDVLNSGGEIQRGISNDQPGLEILQNQVDQTILDPRRDEQVNPGNSGSNPDRPGDRPGGGPDRPGGGDPGGYPGNNPGGGDRPGNGNGNPGGGDDRPGNGNGNPNPGNGGDRPGNGNGNPNPGNGGDRPGNGNGNPNPGNGGDRPGNGNGNPGGGDDRPGNGNGNPNPGNGGDRPGNGNGNPNPGNGGDRPGNGNGNPNPGNGNPGNGNGNGNPGNGNGNGNENPGNGNGNENPGNGNGNPGNGNGNGNENPGNGNENPGNGNGNPGNGNGNGNENPGNGGDHPGNGNGNPGNGNGNGNENPGNGNERPRNGQGGRPRGNTRR